MGRVFKKFLDNADSGSSARVFACVHCQTHFSTSEDILSKAFQGQHGKAYLFHKVVNITEGNVEDRSMTTGLHSVADVYCLTCGNTVGWKYIKAFNEDQRYKEGKIILERALFTEIY